MLDKIWMRSWGSLLGILAGVAAFVLATSALQGKETRRSISEMEVALPWFIQVIMTGGDRYLAAEVNTVRALVSSTAKMDAGNYRILARVQEDASWLNPGNADNYYLAAAILPWNDELDASQRILMNATHGRPFDSLPPFYYGFNIYYFNKDPTSAARWMRAAAAREDSQQNRFALENIAAKWYEKGNDPAVAISLVEAMAMEARDPAFRRYLLQRVERLRMLQSLIEVAEKFEAQTGRKLKRLDELIVGGYVTELPVDPLKLGFGVDNEGHPVLLNRAKKSEE